MTERWYSWERDMPQDAFDAGLVPMVHPRCTNYDEPGIAPEAVGAHLFEQAKENRAELLDRYGEHELAVVIQDIGGHHHASHRARSLFAQANPVETDIIFWTAVLAEFDRLMLEAEFTPDVYHFDFESNRTLPPDGDSRYRAFTRICSPLTARGAMVSNWKTYDLPIPCSVFYYLDDANFRTVNQLELLKATTATRKAAWVCASEYNQGTISGGQWTSQRQLERIGLLRKEGVTDFIYWNATTSPKEWADLVNVMGAEVQPEPEIKPMLTRTLAYEHTRVFTAADLLGDQEGDTLHDKPILVPGADPTLGLCYGGDLETTVAINMVGSLKNDKGGARLIRWQGNARAGAMLRLRPRSQSARGYNKQGYAGEQQHFSNRQSGYILDGAERAIGFVRSNDFEATVRDISADSEPYAPDENAVIEFAASARSYVFPYTMGPASELNPDEYTLDWVDFSVAVTARVYWNQNGNVPAPRTSSPWSEVTLDIYKRLVDLAEKYPKNLMMHKAINDWIERQNAENPTLEPLDVL